MTERDEGLERDAIDALFDGGPTGQPSNDALLDEIEELRSMRASWRAALEPSDGGERASEALREARVARRVLQRTTREDLGRRGDLGLLVEFVGDRLRDSALLRLAAAMVIVQLTLVPLVAWQLLRTPEPDGFQARLEPAAPDFENEAPSEEEALEVVGGSESSSLGGRLAMLRFQESLDESRGALRGIADRLERTRTPLPRTAIGRDLASLAAGRAQSGTLRTELDESFVGALVRVEAGLSQLGDGGTWVGLPEALDQLAALVGDENRSARERALAVRAFSHARHLGLAVPAESEAAEDGDEAPLDALTWLRAVADLVEPAAGGDPYVASWVSAVRAL
ncbi:MAG: hypothetical protein AAGA20_05975 [Planctomycetota bacterium]